MNARLAPLLLAVVLPALLATGCSRPPSTASSGQPHKHEHHPPHGGTPVVLGDEAYHIELVLDASAGTLQAFVLDGELENFIRSAAPSFEIVADVAGAPRALVMAAVANPATGETVGDTSLFQTQADWLRTTGEFDAVLRSFTIRGTTFTDVKFNFPKGNDTDG
jgi:hypothetical protein